MDKPSKTEPLSLNKDTKGAQSPAGAPKPPPVIRHSRPPLAKIASTQAVRIRGLRILIIDDDPAKLDALAMILRDLKAEVAVGSRVESGFSQAAKLMPDIVISDLVSPGERGWWLVQRLRRHPILRWTPFILLRWWEETTSGEGTVLIERILDRVEEVLAPIRVLKDRIATKRPLAGRIDTTGPQALLRTLSASKISGVLTVNDAWSIFEATVGGGGLQSIVRRGVDGVSDEGEEALLQFLLCDTAKWSFRLESKKGGLKNLEANLEKSLGRVAKRIQDLFSPPVGGEPEVESLLKIRLEVLSAAAPTLSTIAQRIAKALSEGMSEAEIDVMLADIDDIFETERALHSLVRAGAIRALPKAFEGTRDKEQQKSVHSASYLIKIINEDQEGSSQPRSREDSIATLPPKNLGLYKASNLPEERLAVTMPGVLRAKDGQKNGDNRRAVDQTPQLTEEEMDTTSMLDGGVNASATEADESEAIDDTADEVKAGFFMRLLHDSLIPMPFSEQNRGNKHMWLAIVLALILGGLVVAGLIYLSSGTPSEPPVPSEEF